MKKEKTMDENKKMKNVEMVMKLITTFPDGRREKVEAMMEDIGDEYFTAPASSKSSFHNAFPGGLCDHSLAVAMTLKRLQKDLSPERWPNHQLAFVGLFHDLGKCGVDGEPRYVANPDDWQRKKWGKIYNINENMTHMTIDDATIYTLQKYDIELTAEEYLAIKLADGQYVAENKDYAMREPDLGLLLHWADLWSTKQEKA